MKTRLSKAYVLLTVGFAHWSAYRAMIFIWGITGTIPLIMLSIWLYKAQVSGGSLGGFTAQGFAAYFMAVWLSQHMVYSWAAGELDFQIRTGSLSLRLLRPINPFWETFVVHFSERFVRLPMMLLALGVGLLLIPETRVQLSLLNIMIYIVSIHLALVIRFLISYCNGLLTFWLDQATALEEFYAIIASFTSGLFAPLVLYPAPVQAVIDWTPFPYLLYYPVRILTGAAQTAEIVQVLAIQIAWLIAFGLLCMFLWKRGLRHYGAVGA